MGQVNQTMGPTWPYLGPTWPYLGAILGLDHGLLGYIWSLSDIPIIIIRDTASHAIMVSHGRSWQVMQVYLCTTYCPQLTVLNIESPLQL